MIRPLNVNDLEAFIQIRSDSLRQDPQAFGAHPVEPEDFDRDKTAKDLEAKDERNFILGKFDQGNLLGIVGFIQPQKPKTRHRAFVWGVFVYPQHRGKGIGKALLKATLARAAQIEDLTKVVLSVTDSEAAAKGLYLSLGFKPYALERDAMRWAGESLDELYMEWPKP